ncbi:hypothetical protein Sru01_59500 [Sphaerisporangium rufum]|uniref:Uncharacterized protein n=1 Tax=Sphaerisporangium rufum TaxID=1381558 RepID=A0A919V4A3_9ACTN|nr:hypothetical protein Sru01_59500 [Sphaerisporangium rufum]
MPLDQQDRNVLPGQEDRGAEPGEPATHDQYGRAVVIHTGEPFWIRRDRDDPIVPRTARSALESEWARHPAAGGPVAAW